MFITTLAFLFLAEIIKKNQFNVPYIYHKLLSQKCFSGSQVLPKVLYINIIYNI